MRRREGDAGDRRRVDLVDDGRALGRIVEQAALAEAVALDVEGDGLYAYRPRLCTVQLAWRDARGEVAIAVVDTLAVDPSPLGALLGADGPTKVLHDLAFDARVLFDHGLRLARAIDTAIMARFLGHEATGLSRVAAALLGVTLTKDLQRHDWARRPLGEDELAYLAGDVAHLLDLRDALEARARELDVLDEVHEECAHRLLTSVSPPRDDRPAWSRIKGALGLSPVERAVLRELLALREAAAEAANVAGHRLVRNDALIQAARARPSTTRALVSALGHTPADANAWLEGVRRGVAAGDVPAEERALVDRPPPPPDSVARRRRAEGLVGGWRRDEAARRGVDPQAVLPGHCATALAALIASDPGPEERAAAIAAIPGLGAKRVRLYTEAWLPLFEVIT